jgi:prophage regulatory protein
MSDRIMRRPEVERLTGLSRSTIYEWMTKGFFPESVKLGPRLVGWRATDIDTWIKSREMRTSN